MAALTTIALFTAVYMGTALYRVSSRTLYDMSSRLSQNNISIVHNHLTSYFQSVQDSLTQIIRLPELRGILEKYRISYDEMEPYRSTLDGAIQNVLYLGSASEGTTLSIINIYCKNGFNYSTSPENELPYSDYESARAYFVENGYIDAVGYNPSKWCEHVVLYDQLGRRKHSFLGIRMLYASGTMEELGMIVVAVSEEDLYGIYSGFSPKAMIINLNGQLVSGPDKSLLGSELPDRQLRERVLKSERPTDSFSYTVDGEVRLFSFQRLADNNTFFIIPFEYYSGLQREEYESFVLPIFFAAGAGILISILFAVLLSRGLSSSVLSLKNVVQKVYEGDLSARFYSDNSDEIAYLGEKFNDMLEHINGLFEIQDQDARAKRNLELRLLQSQINPHLLYNTLDSVLWAVKNQNTEKAQELIVSLSEFFKLTLSGGTSLIPLESELSMIRYYITIQRLARGQDIRLLIDIPESLLSHQIIKLTLQPLIENAILHGFSGYRDDGEISITGRVAESELVLSVQDNGIGILPDELVALNLALGTYPPTPGQRHFGLYNVNRRIKNTFGFQYGIYIESSVSEYTRIIIRLPVGGKPRQ